MSKKLFLSFVLLLMAAFTPAVAQQELTVCDSTAYNSYVPIYGLYADSYTKSEFIIPATYLEEMNGGTITNLTWYLRTKASSSYGVANFQIYFKELDAETTTIDAYMGTDGATMVYEGSLDGTQETMSVELNTAYQYKGGNLLVIVYNTVKGTYSSTYFYGINATGASVTGYSSSSLEEATCVQRNFLPKTTFTYVPEGGVVYNKPQNLNVTNVGTNNATLTWEAGGTETAWNVEYKKAADEEWTSAGTVNAMTITLDALENNVAYEARVRSDYGDGQSGWVNASFKTLKCDDMGYITYELTDSYGDGWNGNKIQVIDAATNEVIETLTITAGASATGTIGICLGDTYIFNWVAGSYGTECSFTITDPFNEVIIEHAAGTAPTAGELARYTYALVTCSRPTALAASNVVYNGATLTWTPGDEEQDAWQVIYAEGTPAADAIDMVPIDVTGEATYNITGLTENKTYTAYVRGNCGENDKSNWSDAVTFTTPLQFALPTDLAVDEITAKSAVATWTGNAESYNLRYRKPGGKEIILSQDFEESVDGWIIIDNDGDSNNWGVGNPSQLVAAHSGTYSAFSASYSGGDLTPDNWLVSPQIPIKGTLKFWVAGSGSWPETYTVMVSTSDTNVDSFEAVTADLTTPSGSGFNWAEVTIDLSAYNGAPGYIAFRHYNCTGQYYMILDDITIEGDDIEAGEWITIENATSPQDIEGLAPVTEYEVQVQSVYADGASQWTESVLFTTLNADAMPTNLAVSEITENSAVATWEGVQDKYNVRYRKAATADVSFFESFEEFPGNWTLVDGDGDGYNWQQIDLTTSFSGEYDAVDGTHVAMSRSWINSTVGAVTPDQWLISPQIEDLGGMLRYYVMDEANYPETYRIYISTTDNDTTSFVPVTDDMLTPNGQGWVEVAIDLSQYEGQSGYIAFRHYNCTDQSFMFLDAVGIYKNEVPAGEWTVVENVEAMTYTMEGLDPETDYEVEVQGIYEDAKATTDWTAPVLFTTLEAETPEPVITLDVEFGTYTEAQTVHVTVENMPEGGAIKYQLVPTTAKEEWSDYDDATGIAVNESAALTVAVLDATGAELARVEGEYVIDTQTGIASIGVDGYDNNAWYNLNGQKLSGKPTTPGIYINGNRKVVIK